MTVLAPTMETFFTERLIGQRRASSNTIASYRDTYRLLLAFVQQRIGKTPSQLQIEDLDAELIQRVLAIPAKRVDRQLVSFLTAPEIDALLAAPDRHTWVGRRDHAMVFVAIQTGLRVSELTSTVNADVELGTGAHLRCHGKGRKERITPLTGQTVAVLRVWMAERQGESDDPLFPSRRGGPLARDAVAARITKHARTAQDHFPSLTRRHVTPHVLRHTCAMRLLAAGVDITVIALWLGHESVETTQIYLHADLAIKERALARTTPTGTKPERYRPPDTLLAFLEAL